LAANAVAASPSNALAHFAKAQVLRARRRCAEAIPEYEAALAVNRNWVDALAAIGRCKIYIGPIEEGIAAQQQAIRLSPRDPSIWRWSYRIGEGHLLLSRIDDAILSLEKARNANPAPAYIHAFLAAAYALRGDTERAFVELAEARRLGDVGVYSSIARAQAPYSLRNRENPRPLRSHFVCWPSAGRHARGMTATRRLAAILAVDVASYSRLIGAD